MLISILEELEREKELSLTKDSSIQNKEQELSDLHNTNSQQSKEIEKLKFLINDHTSELASLTTSLSEAMTDNEVLKREIDNIIVKKSEMEAELQEKISKLTGMSASLIAL